MDRRSTGSSHLARQSSVSSSANVFSDVYALQPFDLDNGRQGPSTVGEADHPPRRSSGSDTSRRSMPAQRLHKMHDGSVRRMSGLQRSSRHNSSSSSSSLPRSVASVPNSDVSTTIRRSMTTSSIGSTRAQSPYHGAIGPSHPYAMYSQDTNVARTPSVATTSTLRRPERSYTGPRGPTQPYGMYPQNTISQDDRDPFNDSAHAVGAAHPPRPRPAPRSYQRRLGPDGEDVDDLIGPDGYTEQLPPYTRYANNIPPKNDPEAASTPHAPVPTQQPAPRLRERTTENRNPTSTPGDAPVLSAQTVTQLPSRDPFRDSSTRVSSTSAVDPLPKDERGSFTRRAQNKSKRRVCWGIMPCWLLVVVLVVILLAGLIGAIVGGVLAHSHGVKKGLIASQTPVSATP